MKPAIRMLEDRDREAVMALSLRAWAPVFASLERVLGESGVYAQLHPDWRVNQRRTVETALDTETIHVWVAEADDAVAGFVAAMGTEAGMTAAVGQIDELLSLPARASPPAPPTSDSDN